MPSKTTTTEADQPKRRKRRSRIARSAPFIILKAMAASKSISVVALKKHLMGKGYYIMKNKLRVILAIRRLVDTGALIKTKRSLKLSNAQRKKKVVRKARTTVAKRGLRTKRKRQGAKNRKRRIRRRIKLETKRVRRGARKTKRRVVKPKTTKAVAHQV